MGAPYGGAPGYGIGPGAGPGRHCLMLGGWGLARVTGRKSAQQGLPMPGFGRMSRPVPQPVFVMTWRTGKFLVASGSEPHPGFPPGPPFAAVMGRFSG